MFLSHFQSSIDLDQNPATVWSSAVFQLNPDEYPSIFYSAFPGSILNLKPTLNLKRCKAFLPAMEGSRCEDGSVCFHGKCVPTDWLNCFTEDCANKTIWFKGGCSDAKDPKINVIELGSIPNKWNCLDRCRSIPATACEWQIASGSCYAFTEQIENANGDSLSFA